MRRRPELLRPDRLRRLETPFGWTPLRLLKSGLLTQLSTEAKLLSFFLSLTADRQGLSYWGEERVTEQLGLTRGELAQGRQELCQRDLLAYNGWLYQLLSLPDGVMPVSAPARGLKASSTVRPVEPEGKAVSPEAVGEILRRLRQQLGWDEDEKK